MIGNLVLNQCMQSKEISEIVNLIRRPNGAVENHKVSNVLIQDFRNYDDRHDIFKNVDIAFFCIGAYTGQVSKELFKEITIDYAVGFAKMYKQNNLNGRLCLLSGAGADRTEKSKTDFARFKGMAENQISDLGLEFYAFRPGYIYPVTPRKEPNIMYRITRFLYPVIKLMGNNFSIKSTELANAMVKVGLLGAEREILENKDIIDQL